jgi:hypothetical protein
MKTITVTKLKEGFGYKYKVTIKRDPNFLFKFFGAKTKYDVYVGDVIFNKYPSGETCSWGMSLWLCEIIEKHKMSNISI